MQNELQSAIRFDNFHAVFGSQGVVALAWWLGAQHISQIRSEEQGFPFLYITGHAGSGKTTLLSYLSTLNGSDSMTSYEPAHTTPLGLARVLSDAGEHPVILEDGYGSERTFEWNQLAPLYKSEPIWVISQGGHSQINFKGTLVISTNPPIECSKQFLSRTVHVDLIAPHTADSRYHAQEIQQLTADQASAFSDAVKQQAAQTISTIQRLAPAYAASLYDKHHIQPTARAAQIGGLLMALVDALSLMLNLSAEQRQETLGQVEHNVALADLPY